MLQYVTVHDLYSTTSVKTKYKRVETLYSANS